MRLLDTAWVIVCLLALLSLGCGGSDQSGVGPDDRATTLGMVQGNNQVAAPGSSVATRPSVQVTDAFADPVSDVEVIFAVASGGGSISGETQRTNPSGIATVGSWTLGSTAGINTLTATAAGLSGSPVTFTATVDTTISPWDY
ncbi:MAG TPA: hypothetical protein VFX42_10355 [Gemmatimonadales bacterium]|nr:hypothetical protein [Gemmatimonadales bacterium]